MDLVRVAYRLAVPLQITVEEGPDEPGGLPKRLGSSPRVPVRASLVVGSDCVATIQQARGTADSMVPQTSPAELILRTPASSLDDGVAKTRDLAATLIDLLSFQMQAPIHILQLEALDVSLPLVDGEDRQLSIQPQAGNGFAGLFFTGDMDFQWVIDARMEAQLMEPLPLDSKPRLALWWYLKVLYTPFIIDQFLFLWTALEVLSPLKGDGVQASYRAPCGHLIERCPDCSAPTGRRIQGETLIALLRDAGVEEDAAKRLWRVRQVIHGANRFKSLDDIREIGALVQVLRAAVLTLLKPEIGVPPWESPVMRRVDGPVVGSLGLLAHRALSAEDLELDAHQRSVLGAD